jgi:hypothetical protein
MISIYNAINESKESQEIVRIRGDKSAYDALFAESDGCTVVHAKSSFVDAFGKDLNGVEWRVLLFLDEDAARELARA